MRRTWWERVSCVCYCSPGRPGKSLWSLLPLITNPPQPSSSSGAQLVIGPTSLEPVAIIRHWISPSRGFNLFCLLQKQPDSLRYEDGAGPRGQRGAQSGRQVARPRSLAALQRSTVNSHGVPGRWEKLNFRKNSIFKQNRRNPDWLSLLLPQACAPISHSLPFERVSRWRMQESFLWLLCPWI